MSDFKTPDTGEPARHPIRGFVRKIREALAPDRMVGREFGNFKIEEKIAKGGMSTIYRARAGDGSAAAIKVLDEQFCRDAKEAGKFAFEARLLEGIRHPNLVKGIAHGAIDGQRLYTVMEHLEGRDAGALMRSAGAIGPEMALSIMLQACRALEAIHALGVVHRDVKPDNLMVGPGGHARLIDLGIAKMLSDANEGAWDGKIYGTIYYVAPEQTEGGMLDARADIYSAGASLYRMLCGRHAFESDDLRKLIFLIQGMVPRPPSEARPGSGISPAMDALVMRAMCKSPSERFQSAAEMAVAIESCLVSA